MRPRAIFKLEAKAVRLRTVAGGPDSKGPRQIARELAALRRYGMTPRYYLERRLYERVAGDPANYLAAAEQEALKDAKRRQEGRYRVYDDKTLFDDHYHRSSDSEGEPFPLPEFLGETRAGRLLRAGHSEVPLEDRDGFADALAGMIERSPTGCVFAKPAVANKGAGALLVSQSPSGEKVEQVRQAAAGVDYLFQGAVAQHPELNRLHPNCLNTLRIITGMSRNGSFPVLSVVLRVGRGTQPVDNTHAGGFVAGVHRETGRLRPQVRSLYRYGDAPATRHSGSGVPFGEFVVPHFAEAVALAQRAHPRLPLLYAGWDVGITPDGPALIEGNKNPALLMMEVANGGFKRDPVTRQFLTEQGVPAAERGAPRRSYRAGWRRPLRLRQRGVGRR
jgi:hypothetical protein